MPRLIKTSNDATAESCLFRASACDPSLLNKKKGDPQWTVAAEFLQMFDAGKLLQIIKQENCGLEECVRVLARIMHDCEDAKPNDRIRAIQEIRKLHLMGAISHPELDVDFSRGGRSHDTEMDVTQTGKIPAYLKFQQEQQKRKAGG